MVSRVTDYTETSKTFDIITKGPWVDLRAFAEANDTLSFVSACAYAVANNKTLLLTKDITLHAEIANNIEIPSLIGLNFPTLTLVGEFHLLIGTFCKIIKGININDTKVYFKTDHHYVGDKINYDYGFIFTQKPNTSVPNFLFENITFHGPDTTINGDYRTKGLLLVDGHNIMISNCNVSDTRCAFWINRVANTNAKSQNLTIRDVIFKNTEQCILFFNMEHVTIDNAKLINTSIQASNYTNTAGSDLINFLYSRNVMLSNLYCENPVEKMVYAIMCDYIELSQFEIVNQTISNLIKIIGFMDLDTNTNVKTTNIKVHHGNIHGIANQNINDAVFYLQNASNVELTNITCIWDNAGSAVFLIYYKEIINLRIADCYIKNIRNNLLLLPAKYINTSGLSTYRMRHFIDNFTLENNIIVNPVSITASGARDLFVISNQDGHPLTDADFFHFNNLTIRNNTIIQTLDGANINVNYYEPTSKLNRLFASTVAAPITHMKYENNLVKGCANVNGFIYADSSSSNLQIRGEIGGNTTLAYLPTQNFPCSLGTEYINLIPFPTGTYTAVVKPAKSGLVTNTGLIADVICSDLPLFQTGRKIAATSGKTRMFNLFGTFQCTDGTYCQFFIKANDTTEEIYKVIGDGTVTGISSIIFSNGMQLTVNNANNDFVIYAGNTPVQYVLKATVII